MSSSQRAVGLVPQRTKAFARRGVGRPLPRRPGAPAKRRPASKQGKLTITFQSLLTVIIASFVAFLVLLITWGGTYYSTPLTERVFHPLHSALKPSGSLGHSVGVVGTMMMVMIFLYSIRKRSKTLQKIGTQAQWLQIHVFLGIAGPILVTFHTTGKLGGLVSVAFYSMWAIVVSGFVGRYLYAKIPRTLQGAKMTLEEIEEQLARLVEELHNSERKSEVLHGIEEFLAKSRRQQGGLIQALSRLFLDDIQLPLNVVRIWSVVRRDRALAFRRRMGVGRLVLKQRRLLDKLAVLDASKQLFSFWHIFHKPFTVMTFVIVVIHVSLAIYLGFGPRW